VISDLEI